MSIGNPYLHHLNIHSQVHIICAKQHTALDTHHKIKIQYEYQVNDGCPYLAIHYTKLSTSISHCRARVITSGES